MSYPKISDDPQLQAEYEEMRASGTSHNCAAMFALQTSPGLQTDTRFLHGRSENGFYSRQLQRWVSSRADVKRIAGELGMGIEGSGCNYRPLNDNPRPDEIPYEVAPELVQEYVQDVVDEYPTALADDPELPSKVKKRLEGD